MTHCMGEIICVLSFNSFSVLAFYLLSNFKTLRAYGLKEIGFRVKLRLSHLAHNEGRTEGKNGLCHGLDVTFSEQTH